jgi:WD40 repeat protein
MISSQGEFKEAYENEVRKLQHAFMKLPHIDFKRLPSKSLYTIDLPPKINTIVSYQPYSNIIAVATATKITILDISTRKTLSTIAPSKTKTYSEGTIWTMAFLSTDLLACYEYFSSSFNLLMYNWRTTKLVKQIPIGNEISIGRPNMIPIADRYLVGGCRSGIIVLIDTTTSRVETLENSNSLAEVNCVLCIDNYRLVAGSDDMLITIWDLDTKTILSSVSDIDIVFSLCMFDLTKIAATGYSKLVHIIDISSNDKNPSRITLFGEHEKPSSTIVGLGSEVIVSGCDDNTLTFWNAKEKLVQLQEHTQDIWSICVCRTEHDNELHVVTGSCDGTLKVWPVGCFHPRQREMSKKLLQSVYRHIYDDILFYAQ